MNYYERYDEYGGNEYQLEIIQIDIILISQQRGSNNDFGRPSRLRVLSYLNRWF